MARAVTMARAMRRLFVALALGGGLIAAAHGQAPDFYRGKQLRIIVGHAVGNDYDVGTRFLAKYLVKHIPGQPNIIVQNMPQAASIVAANYVAVQAPRDGTVMGTFSRNLPSQALMGAANIEADPRRFQWLGATSLPGRVCAAWHTSPVKTVEDLFTHELIVGSTASGSALSILPTVFNHVLGTRFRIIDGYKSSQDVVLAVERGELSGVCASWGQFRSFDRLIGDGKLRIIFQAEETPIPDLPKAPSIYAYAKSDEQRQFMRFVFSSVEFGRPYVFPPEVPRDRVELMRRALAETVKDPELVAEAERIKLDMAYRPPEHLERLVASLYATPAHVVEAARKLVPNQQ
jgi:tripartite-type tricarboxylate transporter receptor subunit TctC